MQNIDKHLCRICGQISSFTDICFKTYGEYNLYKCNYCGTVMVNSRPTAEQLKEVYDFLFSQGGYKGHRDRHQKLLTGKSPRSPFQRKMLRKIGALTQGRCMVEIGGGTGAFGIMASSKGWHYVDYDISEVAVNFVRMLGLEAYCFEEADFPPIQKDSVDAVVMWEVIEHVWPVHQYLMKIRESLHDNGVLAISTPNSRRRGYMRSLAFPGLGSPPIHVNFFTEESLSATLQSAGYTRVRFIHRRIYRPEATLRSMVYNLKVALGIYETKTLYVLAQP